MSAKAPPNSCTPSLLLHSLCELGADLELCVKKNQAIHVNFLPHPSTSPAQAIKKNGPEGPFLNIKSMLNELQTDPELSPGLAQLQ